MEGYRFETLDERHRDAVIEIFNYYVQETTAAYREVAVGADFFPNFVGDLDKYPAYAILDQAGLVVGFCTLEALMPISTFSEVAEITYFLHRDHRGKGIGTLALRRLQDDARKMGIKKLVANISSDNIDSIVFHVKNGFEEYGRLRKAGRKFGRGFDIVYMEKELSQ